MNAEDTTKWNNRFKGSLGSVNNYNINQHWTSHQTVYLWENYLKHHNNTINFKKNLEISKKRIR